ncbi:MAG: hypothetical protein ACT4QE_17330 [Anaerolineales bacterium]
MTTEGPALAALTRRLAETPPEFLAEPESVSVVAIVSDLKRNWTGEPLTAAQAAAFTVTGPKVRNRLRLTLISIWLLTDIWFRARRELAAEALPWLAHGLDELANSVNAEKCVTDPDRREELARVCLGHLGLRPAGETEAQAHDRLTTMSTSERQRLIKAARAAEARAQEIREAMRKQAALDAQAKAMQE